MLSPSLPNNLGGFCWPARRAQERFDFTGDENRMLGHLREPHQITDSPACERPSYEQASVRRAISAEGVEIASNAGPGFACGQDGGNFQTARKGWDHRIPPRAERR